MTNGSFDRRRDLVADPVRISSRQFDPLRIPVQSGALDGDRFETELECGRIGLQAEVIVFRIDEPRVGDHRALVLAMHLPSGEVHARKRRLAARAPVHVASELPIAVLPGAIEHPGIVTAVDDVPFGDVVASHVFTRPAQLASVAQGEDVVADDTLLAVVHEQRAVADPVHNVVLDQDASAAFVG
jgi:hypothetical protein